MKAKNIFFPVLSSLLLLVTSCQKDEPSEPVIDIGDFEYLEASTVALPYIGKNEIVFVDSAGNELVMSVEQRGPMMLGGGMANLTDTQPPEILPGSIEYQTKTLEIYLDNNEENLHFRIWLGAYPYPFEPQNRLVADELGISYTDPDKSTEGARILAYLVNRRTYPEDYMEHEVIPSLEVLGKTFSNLVENSDKTMVKDLYYSEEVGIAAFTDFNGKLWCYERMN